MISDMLPDACATCVIAPRRSGKTWAAMDFLRRTDPTRSYAYVTLPGMTKVVEPPPNVRVYGDLRRLLDNLLPYGVVLDEVDFKNITAKQLFGIFPAPKSMLVLGTPYPNSVLADFYSLASADPFWRTLAVSGNQIFPPEELEEYRLMTPKRTFQAEFRPE